MIKLINDMLAAHNEVILYVYGEGRPAKLEHLPDALNGKRKFEFELNISPEFIEAAEEKDKQLLITMAVQIDILNLRICKQLGGPLLLDEKGFHLLLDKEGNPWKLVRYYAPEACVRVVENVQQNYGEDYLSDKDMNPVNTDGIIELPVTHSNKDYNLQSRPVDHNNNEEVRRQNIVIEGDGKIRKAARAISSKFNRK